MKLMMMQWAILDDSQWVPGAIVVAVLFQVEEYKDVGHFYFSLILASEPGLIRFSIPA